MHHYNTFQDQRLFPVLAHSLLGCERRHILVTLQLVGEACRATDCQVVRSVDSHLVYMFTTP